MRREEGKEVKRFEIPRESAVVKGEDGKEERVDLARAVAVVEG